MGNIWEFDMANLKVLHIFGFELDTSSNEIDLLVHDIGDFQWFPNAINLIPAGSRQTYSDVKSSCSWVFNHFNRCVCGSSKIQISHIALRNPGWSCSSYPNHSQILRISGGVLSHGSSPFHHPCIDDPAMGVPPIYGNPPWTQELSSSPPAEVAASARRYLRLPTPEEFKERLFADLRSHVLLLHLAGLLILAPWQNNGGEQASRGAIEALQVEGKSYRACGGNPLWEASGDLATEIVGGQYNLGKLTGEWSVYGHYRRLATGRFLSWLASEDREVTDRCENVWTQKIHENPPWMNDEMFILGDSPSLSLWGLPPSQGSHPFHPCSLESSEVFGGAKLYIFSLLRKPVWKTTPFAFKGNVLVICLGNLVCWWSKGGTSSKIPAVWARLCAGIVRLFDPLFLSIGKKQSIVWIQTEGLGLDSQVPFEQGW